MALVAIGRSGAFGHPARVMRRTHHWCVCAVHVHGGMGVRRMRRGCENLYRMRDRARAWGRRGVEYGARRVWGGAWVCPTDRSIDRPGSRVTAASVVDDFIDESITRSIE